MTNNNVVDAVASNNSVLIDNFSFTFGEDGSGSGSVKIRGAEARSAEANENSVKITNTTILQGDISGALSANGSNSNIVILGNGVELGENVRCFGGQLIDGTSGTANNNVISVEGTADVSQASLYGCNNTTGQGNALNLETGWNGSIGNAENFNIINVGEGVEATFKTAITADKLNTIINIGKDNGDDYGEEGVKESLLIGQIVTEGTGTSSLNFINGGAWKATGKSSVSALQGDVITINVDKAEKDFVKVANNLTDSQVVTLNIAKNEDIGVDVRAGVETVLNTVVDPNGFIADVIGIDEISLKATVSSDIDENGNAQNVITTIKPGDKFVVESDVEVTGDVIAGDVSLQDTAVKVVANETAIATEKFRAESIEAGLRTDVDAIKGDYLKAEDKTELSDAIALKASKEELATEIAGVTSAYEAADADLKAAYTEADANLKNEITSEYTQADANLKGEITSAYTQADANLKGEITSEYTQADANLKGEITSAYTQADANLKNEITSEYTQADANLKNEINDKIADEAATRQAQVDGINQRLGKMNGKINKVGAGAAALAALHPLEYDSDDKLTFAAGVGNYAGENAAALGAFYRPDEKLMFSLGGTMGNGENMVNLGVSIGLDGASGTPKLSKKELVQKVNTMEAENQSMKAEIAELKALVAELAKKK